MDLIVRRTRQTHNQYTSDAIGFYTTGQSAWPPSRPRLEIFRHAESGSLKLLWIMATNPAVSLPELHRIRKGLRTEGLFVIVQDAFMTETAELADVVLPAGIWGEKTGTFTNADRTVHIAHKAVEPPGEARADLDILLDTHLHGFRLSHGGRRVRDVRPRPGVRRGYYGGGVPRPRSGGRAVLKGADYIAPLEEPDKEYPFWLTTGRLVYHFHTRTKTGRCPGTATGGPGGVRATRHGGRQAIGHPGRRRGRGGVAPRHGARTAKVGAILPGHVFIPFHYGYWDRKDEEYACAANELTLTAWDPVSKQPYYKNAAVQVRKAGVCCPSIGSVGSKSHQRRRMSQGTN